MVVVRLVRKFRKGTFRTTSEKFAHPLDRANRVTYLTAQSLPQAHTHDDMRHFLAGVLNCAAALVAALPAICLVPSVLSDFAAISSSGRDSPHVPGDSILAQRND